MEGLSIYTGGLRRLMDGRYEGTINWGEGYHGMPMQGVVEDRILLPARQDLLRGVAPYTAVFMLGNYIIPDGVFGAVTGMGEDIVRITPIMSSRYMQQACAAMEQMPTGLRFMYTPVETFKRPDGGIDLIHLRAGPLELWPLPAHDTGLVARFKEAVWHRVEDAALPVEAPRLTIVHARDTVDAVSDE